MSEMSEKFVSLPTNLAFVIQRQATSAPPRENHYFFKVSCATGVPPDHSNGETCFPKIVAKRPQPSASPEPMPMPTSAASFA